MNLNKVILVGRLTQDPQKKVLNSGKEIVSFSLATDRYYIDKNKQKRQETEFHNIVLFGRLAKIAFDYLKKGSLVLVEGRLRSRFWKDEKGNQNQRVEIIAEKLQLAPKSISSKIPKEEEKIKEEIPLIEEEEIDLEDIPF